jgi:DMSO/TMAO reductase YedYZ molybdopterin-dependent catalytic subunit
MEHELLNEGTYDRRRLTDFLAGRARADGISRRDLIRLSTAVGLAPALAVDAGASAAAAAPTADGPIVKPLPPELLTALGTNAEMRWSAMKDQGHLVPIDRFFVRNHTSTPPIDPDTWRLQLFGAGLHDSPTADAPVEIDLRQLRRLPSETLVAAIECAGNGRRYYTSQQGQTVSGTPWGLGAVGVARWRGVRLSTVLRRAGLSRRAVDVMPSGLDPHYVTGGVDLGPVRRPLPVRKAMHDVLLAYEMNGEPLPPDHGHPVRLVVPSWIGIASIKWLGRVEIADTPLFSPWNTQFYRLFGPGHPADGTPFDRQVTKSAFELDEGAQLPVGHPTRLTGRSWSPNGVISRVDVSSDGARWRPARLIGPGNGWQRWEIDWCFGTPGGYELRARATCRPGVTQPDVAQPDVAAYNTLGYLFGGIVRHRVVAVGD